jgi:hypothetical protein
MIRFVNETGISNATQMIDTETGEDIGKKLAVEYGAQITIERDLVIAKCRLSMLSLSVVAGKVEYETRNPRSDRYERVRAIEFHDGSRVEISEDGIPSLVST